MKRCLSVTREHRTDLQTQRGEGVKALGYQGTTAAAIYTKIYVFKKQLPCRKDAPKDSVYPSPQGEAVAGAWSAAKPTTSRAAARPAANPLAADCITLRAAPRSPSMEQGRALSTEGKETTQKVLDMPPPT